MIEDTHKEETELEETPAEVVEEAPQPEVVEEEVPVGIAEEEAPAEVTEEEVPAEVTEEEVPAEITEEEAPAETTEEEVPAETTEEEVPAETTEEEAPAETTEEEVPAETTEEETPAEVTEEEVPEETTEEEPQEETTEEEVPVIPVQTEPVRKEDNNWAEIEAKISKRQRSRRGMRILAVVLSLLLVGALAAAACYFFLFNSSEEPAYLRLPQTVKLKTVTAASLDELKPEDFVDGLEGTGITVAFGQDFSKDKQGKQDFTLIFTQNGKTCSRTASLYRYQIIPQVTKQLGETYVPNIRDFVPDKNVAAQFISEVPNPKTQAGIFDLTISCDGKEHKVQLVITENIPPVAAGMQVTVTAGETPDASTFVQNVLDHTQVTITFKEDPRFDMAGERSVTVVLTDLFGNTTEVTTELIVEPHENGPRFNELSTIYVQVGNAVSYKTGVTVTDPQDGELTFTVNSANVDIHTVGKYMVYYTAVDSQGNKLTVGRHVVVETKTGHDLRIEAQMVLDRIITPGMTQDEKIWAIFIYARWNVQYIGTSDKSSIENAAYEGFTQGRGDCYTYYAMVRVMLDMEGISNVECQRVGGDSNHWWNLVQFEDGKYYHVDATPHKYQWVDYHCKLTESFLVEYTNHPDVAAHRPNYYVYDHTLPQYQGIEIAQ